MVDVFAAVDSTTGAFGTLVQNRLKSDMQSAINAGVQQAISGATVYKGDKGEKGDAGASGNAILFTIQKNTDWNTLTTGGWYAYNSPDPNWQGQVNAPTKADPYGVLEVIATTTATIQRYLQANAAVLWIRERFEGAGWSTWRSMTTITAGRNAITGWFHVTDYGATPNQPDNDDAPAIQAAIDAAAAAADVSAVTQRVFFPAGNYSVGTRNMIQSGGNADGICSMELKNGVELYGPSARINVKSSAYGSGAYYAIVRSKYEGLYNAGIDGLTFDGNRGGNTASNNAGNILLEAAENVWVRNVTSIESNGNGIMVRGNAYGAMATDVRILDNKVVGVNGIGIQASQFDGLIISRNRVQNTSDNGIDVYGQYGDNSTNLHGINFQINDNHCRSCATGLFLETVGYGVVVGNRVSNCGVGIRTNRIYAAPTSLGIKSNGFFGCQVGAAFSGVMDAVSFDDNEVQGASTAGIQFDGLQTAGIFADSNFMNTTANNVPLILATSFVSQLSQIYVVNTKTKLSSTVTLANYAQSNASITVGSAHGPGF